MHLVHGVFDTAKAGHQKSYYETRGIFLDCRGDLSIHPSTNWGWDIMVITQTHDISGGAFGPAVNRKVIIEHDAWICSGAILYNCTIGHHAIVAAGAVVRNMTVEPYTIVEGNPARVTKKFTDGKWVPIERTPSEAEAD